MTRTRRGLATVALLLLLPAPAQTEPLWSFDIPTPDGVTLATDVYAASLDPQPILLLRTPYDKSASAERGWLLAAQRGAAVVIQDTRGQGASIGTDPVFRTDAAEREGFERWT